MNGEISLFGVFVPSLLLLAIAAGVLTGIVTRLLSVVGAYRLFAYRPLVDVAIYIFLLGALALVFAAPGTSL